MKKQHWLFGLAAVILAASVWALLKPGEDKTVAFSRILPRAPGPLVLKDYWKAQGIGGDGLNVFTFSLAQDEISKWMQSLGYQLVPSNDDVGRMLLLNEIQKVEQRIRRLFPLQPPYSHYYLYESGRQKHILFDTNSPAHAVYWSFPGSPLDTK